MMNAKYGSGWPATYASVLAKAQALITGMYTLIRTLG